MNFDKDMNNIALDFKKNNDCTKDHQVVLYSYDACCKSVIWYSVSKFFFT